MPYHALKDQNSAPKHYHGGKDGVKMARQVTVSGGVIQYGSVVHPKVGRMATPKSVQALIPGTCDYITLHA